MEFQKNQVVRIEWDDDPRFSFNRIGKKVTILKVVGCWLIVQTEQDNEVFGITIDNVSHILTY